MAKISPPLLAQVTIPNKLNSTDHSITFYLQTWEAQYPEEGGHVRINATLVPMTNPSDKQFEDRIRDDIYTVIADPAIDPLEYFINRIINLEKQLQTFDNPADRNKEPRCHKEPRCQAIFGFWCKTRDFKLADYPSGTWRIGLGGVRLDHRKWFRAFEVAQQLARTTQQDHFNGLLGLVEVRCALASRVSLQRLTKHGCRLSSASDAALAALVPFVDQSFLFTNRPAEPATRILKTIHRSLAPDL